MRTSTQLPYSSFGGVAYGGDLQVAECVCLVLRILSCRQFSRYLLRRCERNCKGSCSFFLRIVCLRLLRHTGIATNIDSGELTETEHVFDFCS